MMLHRHIFSRQTFLPLLQVFVNFAKQQSREDDAIVLHPKAAGAQRYIDTTPLKNLGKSS